MNVEFQVSEKVQKLLKVGDLEVDHVYEIVNSWHDVPGNISPWRKGQLVVVIDIDDNTSLLNSAGYAEKIEDNFDCYTFRLVGKVDKLVFHYVEV